ncbi:MAG: GNAT family N-acetyltransferase [Bacteroidales bacterium]|nr:GNAT family N-acetyltransferase [Bacteroidales bacterium]MCF8402963.1 GNAT family N-acetyltransferase [Bacteroidales bacterium]
MQFRSRLKKTDQDFIKEILDSSGFFYDYEIEIAIELLQENLAKGAEKSGYFFTIAEIDHIPVGYTCYGKTPGTIDSFDLYWIAVHQEYRGKGIGNRLMDLAVNDIAKRQGQNIWIETSSRELYKPTHLFYIKYGCEKIAELPDFYGPGDHKIIFRKKISST